MTRRRAPIAIVVSLLALGACGDDDDDGDATDRGSASAPASAPSDACATAAELQEIDDRFQSQVGEAVTPLLQDPEGASDEAFARFRDVLDQVEDEGDRLLGLYDDLEAALDGELAESARTLGDFTADVLERLADVQSVEDLQAFTEVVAGQESADAIQATVRLDAWSQEECGVVLAD